MRTWNTAGYLRLSREDGDKSESDSIAHQRRLLEQYLAEHPELRLIDFYQDDGYTGTHFDRPSFRRMEEDMAAGIIDCILVKDLSRFGRDYIEVGRYLEKEFPARGVRFIAVNDGVDSEQGRYDMLLPIKNLFNTQYAKDISDKVRSTIRSKQRRGEFIGAFPSYGYRKDPRNHNHLEIDPPAACVVQRIFDLCEAGLGQLKIAKTLNAEHIPSPSEYKRLSGERYHNGRRMDQTTYWTYATVHRILQNQMYLGNMEQGRSERPGMHGKARQRQRAEWIVVPGTHDPIISREQWERVQSLLQKRTRQLSFEQNQSPFAGFLRCGVCGRAMVKTRRPGGLSYSCGSYKRYGPTVCTRHSISHAVLEQIVLEDLNCLLSSAGDLNILAQRSVAGLPHSSGGPPEGERLESALQRLRRLKKSAYEDYRDGLLSRVDYLAYQADYEAQIQALTRQLAQLAREQKDDPLRRPWVDALLRQGKLTELDRVTVAETIREIRVFPDHHLEITYTFADDAGLLSG
ncbi:recombinase family protein [Pseudoflavonifractor gallinarum]|uniref:recombinase family protein n=1 Tax=Pseudoflavonifractor gallinarum TaxID=2779352 RepID=UPI0036F4068F